MRKNFRCDAIEFLSFLLIVTLFAQAACHKHSPIKEDKITINAQSHPQSNQANPSTATCFEAKCPSVRIRVQAGVLHAKLLHRPKPEYPAEAKTAGISGEVKVELVINEKGNVACAKILSGHPVLQEAVKKVVCEVRCQPAKIGNVPVTFAGLLTYKFVLS